MLNVDQYQPLSRPYFKRFRGRSLNKLRASYAFNIPGVDDVALRERAQACLARIEDPLWKHVCTELQHISPSFVLRLWSSRLGRLSAGDDSTDLHCPDQETADFVRAYDFVILGSLHTYFPMLKEVVCLVSR